MRVARGYPIRSVGHGRAVLTGNVDASAMGPLDTSQMEGELGGEGGQPKSKDETTQDEEAWRKEGSGGRARR